MRFCGIVISLDEVALTVNLTIYQSKLGKEQKHKYKDVYYGTHQ